MSGGALIAMLVILGVVWGGFTVLLVYALRRESMKRRAASPFDGQDTESGGTGGIPPHSSGRRPHAPGQDSGVRASHGSASDTTSSNDQET